MKTHFVLSATAASLLASCATDPALAEKKKSVSIGRFGVTHNTLATPQAPSVPATAPEAQKVVSAPSAPAPASVQEAAPAPAPEKKNLFANWGKKKEEQASPTPAPAPEKEPFFSSKPRKSERVTAVAPPVEKPAAAPAPAPVQEAAPAPAPEKKNLFANWGKKKEAQAAPAPAAAAEKEPFFSSKPRKSERVTAVAPPAEKPASAPAQVAAPAPAPEKKNLFAHWGKKKEEQAAPAPAPQQGGPAAVSAPKKKTTVSIGRFGVTRTVSDEEVAAVPAPVQEAAPAPEKKSRFSWFNRKNNTADAPVAVQVQDKPAVTEKKEKQEKQAPKQRVAKTDAPVEFKERDRSKPLSDDIRLPNMYDLPDGKDLKSSGSTTKKTGKEGAVISRPPVEEKKE